jgi:uncharacterized protein (DUF983 family)
MNVWVVDLGVRRELLDALEPSMRMRCPNCKTGLVPDALVVNKELRRTVEAYLRSGADSVIVSYLDVKS